jgi:hypothetical protein
MVAFMVKKRGISPGFPATLVRYIAGLFFICNGLTHILTVSQVGGGRGMPVFGPLSPSTCSGKQPI